MEFHIWTSLLSSLFPHCTSRNHTMFSGLLFGHAVGLRLPSHFHGNFSFSQCYCKVSRCPDLHKNCVITFADTEIADRPVGARRQHCSVEEQRQVDAERSKVYHMEWLERNFSDIHKNTFGAYFIPFRKGPDCLRGIPILLFKRYRRMFTWGEASGSWCWSLAPSSADISSKWIYIWISPYAFVPCIGATIHLPCHILHSLVNRGPFHHDIACSRVAEEGDGLEVWRVCMNM